MAMPIMKIRSFLVALILFGMTVPIVSAGAQAQQDESSIDVTAPVEPPSAEMSGSQLLAELALHDQVRNAALSAYTEQRTYLVMDTAGKVRVQESGQMEYRAPGKMTFVMTSETGSGLVRRLAFNPLIASEIETASGKRFEDSAITPANYTFELLGVQNVGPYRCFVVWATPKRPDKYLFEGKVWIDAEDYAIVRVAGHPAKKLSFWIDQVDFVREFQRIDGFWLPQKDQSFVQVKMYGKKVLTIEHQYYAVSGGGNTGESEHNVSN
jgi:hypothetical protein